MKLSSAGSFAGSHASGGIAIGASSAASDERFMRVALEEAQKALGGGVDPLMYGQANTTHLVPFHEMTGDRFYRDIFNDTDAQANMLAVNQATTPSGPFKSGGVFLHTGFLIETELRS